MSHEWNLWSVGKTALLKCVKCEHVLKDEDLTIWEGCECQYDSCAEEDHGECEGAGTE